MTKSKRNRNPDSSLTSEGRIYLSLAGAAVIYLLINLFPSLSLELFSLGLVFLIIIILRLGSRFTIGFGILMLFLLPPSIHLHHENLAEKIAAVAFLVLISGVLQQAVELLRGKDKDENEDF